MSKIIETSETSGILMFNCGTDMLVRAIVALNTIRKHYDGNITFYVEDPCPTEFQQVLREFNCGIIHLPESKENPLIKKISIFANAPYDKNLFLDLDIVMMDKIDSIFGDLNEVDVVIPHFEEKFTSAVKENLCSGRVKKYLSFIDKEIIIEALNNHPAINTGVIAFRKSEKWESFLTTWIELAKKGSQAKIPIVDESSFQVLYPVIDRWGITLKIISGNYNIYVLSDKTYEDPKIYHFCGNKHCTSDTPLSSIWINAFEEMRKTNAVNIDSFLQYSDKRLSEYLKGNPVPHKKDKGDSSKGKTEVKIENNREMGYVDKNDDSSFRHPRERHVGYTTTDEFNQQVPHFFTNDRATINIEGMYKGRSAFMICNGPSFVKLDQNLLSLPGVMTFGINNGPKTHRPNFWTCVDDPSRFLKSIWMDAKIMKFIPQSHFDKKIFDNEKWEMTDIFVRDCPNVVGYMRNEKFEAEKFMMQSSLNWGNHKDFGGCRSVMLPSIRILHLLGFRKVYLLGCDMKMTETYAYHFDEQRSKGAVSCNNSTYDRLKSEYFPKLKPYFDKVGFQVFNCNPESELKVFPFISFEDAIKEATSGIPDYKTERVWGLYSKPEEKADCKKEAEENQKIHLKTIKELEKQKNKEETVEEVKEVEETVKEVEEVEEVVKAEVVSAINEVPVISSVNKTDKPIVIPAVNKIPVIYPTITTVNMKNAVNIPKKLDLPNLGSIKIPIPRKINNDYSEKHSV